MKTIKELEMNKYNADSCNEVDTSKYEEHQQIQIDLLKDVLKLIDERIKYHQAQFDKYEIETRVYADNEEQVEYSKANAIKHMKIINALEELKARITG